MVSTTRLMLFFDGRYTHYHVTALTREPEGGARCVSSARRDLCHPFMDAKDWRDYQDNKAKAHQIAAIEERPQSLRAQDQIDLRRMLPIRTRITDEDIVVSLATGARSAGHRPRLCAWISPFGTLRQFAALRRRVRS